MLNRHVLPTQNSSSNKQWESDTGECGEPLPPHTREDDHEGQEEGDKDNVESEGGHICCHRSPVAVGVQSRTSILAKRIKPSTCHIDDLASRQVWKDKLLNWLVQFSDL